MLKLTNRLLRGKKYKIKIEAQKISFKKNIYKKISTKRSDLFMNTKSQVLMTQHLLIILQFLQYFAVIYSSTTVFVKCIQAYTLYTYLLC